MAREQDLIDDLGDPVPLQRPPSRVVSLVPSLTEAIAVSAPDVLVAATDWCTHPPSLDVARVRGTKNPNRQAVADAQPELVVANKEENRKTDVDALRRAGIPVWVTVIETLPQAFASLRRLFVTALQRPSPTWLGEAERVWAAAPELPELTAAVPIWRDPWMVVGSRTFTGDVLSRLGVRNVFADARDRYPKVSVDDVRKRAPDVVVLPDEPYRFTAQDGPETFPGQRIALVEGRSLTWYGPSLLTARHHLVEQLSAARTYS